ncbi:tyrosine decarboxylase MnfA [Candidatus Altiarchaeales archaeon WOR_SM1_SCG]|nr:tyrosine decarboxylase MnfA [Candidatus Altiarchaeales archaeon WOR_SM1_SCG]
MDDEKILNKLRELRAKDPDFSKGRVFSAVSSPPLEVALDAFKIFADTNALDEHLFSATGELERECISWLGNLLHNPKAAGYITTGGTEANMFALWAARESSKNKNEIIVPESAHYSIEKIARVMNLKINYTGLDENFRADVSEIESKINDKTLAVIATAGTPSLEMIDPVAKINELCDNIFLHVDAAFGGFVIPFLDRKIPFDFKLSNVSSITIDPHKMGLAPFPSGAVILRSSKLLKNLKILPPYLPIETYTLLGSRSGGAIASTWATFKSLGFAGYKKIVSGCMENTKFFCRELKVRGFELLTEPDLNCIGIKIDNEKIVKKLEYVGWKISMNHKPKSLRIVVMPHVNKEDILAFIDDMEKIAGVNK